FGFGGGPMRCAAAGRAMPQIERTIALLVRDAPAFDGDLLGAAVMPQTPRPAADRAIAFAGIRWRFAQCQADAATMTAAVMLAHPRISATHAGTSTLAVPSRVSSNQAEPWLRSRLSSSVRARAL